MCIYKVCCGRSIYQRTNHTNISFKATLPFVVHQHWTRRTQHQDNWIKAHHQSPLGKIKCIKEKSAFLSMSLPLCELGSEGHQIHSGEKSHFLSMSLHHLPLCLLGSDGDQMKHDKQSSSSPSLPFSSLKCVLICNWWRIWEFEISFSYQIVFSWKAVMIWHPQQDSCQEVF